MEVFKRDNEMKRSCFTISPNYQPATALVMARQPTLTWTMMFAVTLATVVFGIVWFG
jgi:hypothetical protein